MFRNLGNTQQNNFWDAMTFNDTFTENAMPTHSTSGSYLLDFFYMIGGSRQKSANEIIVWFHKAYNENPLLAVKCLFYNRDVRGGQGERRSFRVCFRYLAYKYPEIAVKYLQFIPTFGRWDDVWYTTYKTPLENDGFDFILSALKGGDGLACKWMPRDNKKFKEIALAFCKYTKLNYRDYRKLLVRNTKVVENLMCKNLWPEINYNQVPSVASHKYRKAFGKHDNERYVEWLKSLSKPESGNKIHAGAIFPHDIVKSLWEKIINNSYWDRNRIPKFDLPDYEILQLNEQWKALPNYIEDIKFLPVCDVSGSMMGLPILVSVALGIYLSERNKSFLKDIVVTFSQKPTFLKLSGNTLSEKVLEFARINMAQNTDLEAVFNLLLTNAKRANLPQEDMPQYIILLSDMQFDTCVKAPSNNSYQMISRMYSESGYKLPNVIFWNLRSSEGIPVKMGQNGTALVSGFSPSIFTSLLGGELNPMTVMLETLNKERYDVIQ